jgi:hypothetical protein
MDRDPSNPLSPEEAKARLRAAARELSVDRWIGRRTWSVLAIALAGGFIVGRTRVPAITGTLLMERVVPLLLAVWLRKKGTPSPSGR